MLTAWRKLSGICKKLVVNVAGGLSLVGRLYVVHRRYWDESWETRDWGNRGEEFRT